MKKLIRRGISPLILFLFLIPFIGSSVHAITHIDDIHCFHTGVHFHQVEHHCELCDFLVPVTTSPAQGLEELNCLPSFSTQFSFLHIESGFTAPEFNFSLRGPPFII